MYRCEKTGSITEYRIGGIIERAELLEFFKNNNKGCSPSLEPKVKA